MDEAILHCTRGIGIWDWASNDQGGEPDVVMACAGDVPTLEALAAVDLLRHHLPELKVRFVNVVDLMRLQDETEHPHGLSDAEFDSLFTTDKPIVFAYHGYPWLIHRLTYRRTNHANLHVRGYKEEGTTTTPFDMVMLNDLDRFHLVIDVIDRVPGLASRAGHVRQHHGRQAARGTCVHPARGRGHARDRGLDLAGLDCVSDGADRAGAALARILVVNAGSSSLKLRVLDPDDAVVASADLGPIDGDEDDVGAAVGCPRAGRRRRASHRARRQRGSPGRCASTPRSIAGHPGAHGPRAAPPAASLAALEAVGRSLPGVPAVACFDTAFHATLPAAASTYALPAAWRERWGLRRYGFHGLSHAYASAARDRAAGCRVGRGCGSSPATSAPARRWPRFAAGARSTRRWASRRSRGS